MPQEKLTVGVVGAGAVGSILASCLAEAGAGIVVADIPVRKAQIDQNGLRVTWNDRQLNHRVGTVDSISALRDADPDLIFIATKACILKKLMPDVSKAADGKCLVMSVQNGIGTEDEIAKYVESGNVARMVVNYAGRIDENGDVFFNWFNPPNSFGLVVEQENSILASFVDKLNSIGLESALVDPVTIKKKAFFKTVLNSALMPLCATMGLTMSEAMGNPVTRQLACDILSEGLAVGSKLGFDYGEGIHEVCVGYLDKGGNHHPSMSVDLKNKRPTEIDFINGKILELGRQFDDVSLDTNRVVTSLLVSMEHRNGTRAADDVPDYLRKS